MIKKWLVLTLLLGILVFAGLSSHKQSESTPGLGPMAFQAPIPSIPTPPVANSCPATCSARLTATDTKVLELEALITQLRDAMNHDMPILNERTLDLNDRLKKLEGKANWDKAQAELNGLDARVAQLERPEVEDDAK